MNKKTLLLALFSTIAITACGGKETVIREVLVTTPTPATEAPVLETQQGNKYDQYLEFVYDNSGQARDWTESDLMELASIVCEAFDSGATLSGIVEVFSNNSEGRYDDELYAAVIGGAVTFICPEWSDYVNSELS